MAREITITINEDMSLHVEAFGYQGKGCTADLDDIQRILGLSTTEQKAKPELLRTVSVTRARR